MEIIKNVAMTGTTGHVFVLPTPRRRERGIPAGAGIADAVRGGFSDAPTPTLTQVADSAVKTT